MDQEKSRRKPDISFDPAGIKEKLSPILAKLLIPKLFQLRFPVPLPSRSLLVSLPPLPPPALLAPFAPQVYPSGSAALSFASTASL